MSAVLPLAAIALTAGSQIYGGIEENRQQKAAARVDEENGRLALKGGEQQAMDTLREAAFQQGEAAASMGPGLVFGGSIATVLADSARAAEMDIARVREQARGEAANHYAQAKERRKAGKAALIGGIFSAVASTVSSAAGMKNEGALAGQAAKERGVRLGTMGAGGGSAYVAPKVIARARYKTAARFAPSQPRMNY